MIKLLYPKDGAKLSLVTAVQREYMEKENAGMNYDMYKLLYRPVDDPDPNVTFLWLKQTYGAEFKNKYPNNPDEVNLTKPRYIEFGWASDTPCRLEVEFDQDTNFPGDPEPAEIVYLSDSRPISVAEAGNLFARTKYKWRIVSQDGSEQSEYRRFTTTDEFPRAIFAEGSANIRDIGAVPRKNGGHIRQGCIYRGAALENIVDSGYSLTERGRRALADIVKIKSDVDFRFKADAILSESPIGKNTSYHVLPARGYEAFFEPEYIPWWKPILEFVADENNYPILLHCAAGADRTGTFFQILEVLLDADFDYVRHDYTLTSLTQRDYRFFVDYGECGRFLSGYTDGDDIVDVMRGNIEKFFYEKCGVSPETIQKIRSNLIED